MVFDSIFVQIGLPLLVLGLIPIIFLVTTRDVKKLLVRFTLFVVLYVVVMLGYPYIAEAINNLGESFK